MPAELANLLPLLLILAVFYLLILRPARNRQREAARLQGSLAVGQQVMTTAGLYGTVTAVRDDAVVLEIAPGVTSRWAKGAIARVVPADAPAGDVGEARTAPDGPKDASRNAVPDDRDRAGGAEPPPGS